MALPTFLGIGVQRAATTWMYHCFREHPEIFIARQKEVHFFNRHFDRGRAWYERQFTPSERHKAVGEITPTYMHAVPISRIAKILPDAKILIILREPVQRAFSAYQLLHQRSDNIPFLTACKTSKSLISRSLYAERLADVFDHFPQERIKVLLYDDIVSMPDTALAEVFQFLEVDPTFVPESRDKMYNRVILPDVQAAIDTWKLGWLIKLVKKTRTGEAIKWFFKSRGDRVLADKAEKDFANLHKLFRDDVLKVQDLIGRDLSAWL